MKWLWLALLLLLFTTVTAVTGNPPPLVITRHHLGDIFSTSDSPCSSDVCVGRSSGTAGLEKNQGFPTNQCSCQCMPNLPIFRDDKHICVDDLNECILAPFVSGSTVQKIPFVFLPLKGQIVYPSAEIHFRGSVTPMCVVSKALFLTGGGWADLRNRSDTEPPFRLFRDEGRTFLRWLGDADLRLSMEGRLIKVDLICKEVDKMNLQDQQIFTPCVAFRVAGTPSVREVTFSADMRNAVAEEPSSGSLSLSEQIAIGIFCVSIGFIYVAAIYFYLRKRHRIKRSCFKSDTESADGDGNTRDSLIIPDEGVVKNNPLLQHCTEGQDNEGFLSESGGSCCSDTERSDNCHDDKMQRTSAMIHPRQSQMEETIYNMEPLQLSDQNTIERLPEENVSIVETLDQREDRPETVKAMTCANTRKKLYFNPAYFEPELLLAPPPAAIEFLTKIREVIAIAKHKMAAKKFTPNLIGIPEEDYGNPMRPPSRMSSVRSSRHGGASYKHQNRSRPSSLVKEENNRSRRNSTISCEDCPDCRRELQQQENMCRHCYNNNHQAETKQKSIRKWLQDVPLQPKCPLSDSESVASSKCSRRSCHNRAIAKRQSGVDEHHFSSRLLQSGGPVMKFIENEFNDQSSILSGRSNNSGKSGRSGRSGKSAQSGTSYRSGRSCRSNLSRKSIAFSNLPYVNQQNEINRMKTIQEDMMSTVGSEAKKQGSAASRTKMKPPPCPPPPPPPPSSTCSAENGTVDTESLRESPVSKENFKVPKVAKKLMDAVIKEFVGQRNLPDAPDQSGEQTTTEDEEVPPRVPETAIPTRSKISETRSPLPMKKNGESKLNSKMIVHQHNPALNNASAEKQESRASTPIKEPRRAKEEVNLEELSRPCAPLRLDSLKIKDECRLSDFETDSLDRSIYDLNGDDRGIRTPSDYGDIILRKNDLSNGVSNCSLLPMDEEVVMRNDILNMTTGNKTISKLSRNPRPQPIEDHEYEIISMAQNEIQTGNTPGKNDILGSSGNNESEGYSLVSEVYINDTFSSGSTSNSSSLTSNQSISPTQPTNSNAKEAKIHYKQQPGHLMIEVEDTDHTYNPDDSDSFEPDTLDRKPVLSKLKLFENNNTILNNFNKNPVNDSIYTDYEFTDSLERPPPPHVNGGFKRERTLNEDLNEILNKVTNSHNIGNLRAIFESKQNNQKKNNAKPEKKYINHKTKAEIEMNQINLKNDKNSKNDKSAKKEKSSRSDKNFRSDNSLSSLNAGDDSDTDYSTLSWNTEKDYGKFLNVDSKHARRQRQPSPPNTPSIELIPPRPPKPSDYYNEIELKTVDKTPPLPPRSIKPPLPPKNAMVRSTSREKVELPPKITKLTLSEINSRPLPELPNVNSIAPAPQSKAITAASGRTKSPISSDYEAMNTDGRRAGDDEKPSKPKLLVGANMKRSKKRLWRHYTEDSGYLSTDSNESNENRKRTLGEIISGSETDESFDGASESGAESMATDSFFYGNNFRKTSTPQQSGTLSVDSGLNQSDTDSNVSFVTVLPTENKNAKIFAKNNMQKMGADNVRR